MHSHSYPLSGHLPPTHPPPHPKETNHTSDDILLFEKLFLEIYHHYQLDLSLTIDLSQNMLHLCLDHLISFCCWARSDSRKSEWLHKLLLENGDLRPEVRNGIALVIIYVFASAKEHLESENIDMFGVLQDPHYGLGIVHKTSLRIYNDPLNYFGFLKCCITGLIFAHAIPENERHNKPKSKARQTEQVALEVESFVRMKEIIYVTLRANQHHAAQEYIRQILLFWQTNKHKVRETWFSAALTSISPPNIPQLTMQLSNRYIHQPSYDSTQPHFSQYQPTTSQAQSTKENEPLDTFWDGESALDIGFGLDDPYGMETSTPQPQALHPSANSSNLPGLLASHDHNYFGGISSFHYNTPATVSTAPSSNRSSPVSSVGGRAKFSRENSYDTLETAPPYQGILSNRERYRDNHFHSDYTSDADQSHHSLPHGIEIDHDGRGSHPTKVARVDERVTYDSTLDDDLRDTESSHECGNSDSGSVAGNYSHVVPHPGQPIGRSVSDCSIMSDIHISPATQSVPIQHSFSCNSLPGPTMKAPSLSQMIAHTSLSSHHGHLSPHSATHLNSFHIGGHSGHSHSSLLHHRALVNVHESKVHRHHSGDNLQIRHSLNQHLSPASVSSTNISTRSSLIGFHQPLQILRFTKISSQTWLLNIDKVYQIELFLTKLSGSVVYLIDDKLLPQQEWSEQKLTSMHHNQLSGVNELQKELELRQALVTSWPPQLHEQLIGFVNNWSISMSHYEEQKTIHDRGSPSSPSSIRNETPLNEPPSLLSLWWNGPITLPRRPSSSTGVLAYEISLQLGVVIRAYPSMDDTSMWCLMYLHDILHDPEFSSWTCADFFSRIFPQFASLTRHLTQGQGDINRIAIKYCSHPMTAPIDQHEIFLPPSNTVLSAYQTIGLLSDPAPKIISRFQGELPLFHDILLFSTY